MSISHYAVYNVIASIETLIFKVKYPYWFHTETSYEIACNIHFATYRRLQFCLKKYVELDISELFLF